MKPSHYMPFATLSVIVFAFGSGCGSGTDANTSETAQYSDNNRNDYNQGVL